MTEETAFLIGSKLIGALLRPDTWIIIALAVVILAIIAQRRRLALWTAGDSQDKRSEPGKFVAAELRRSFRACDKAGCNIFSLDGDNLRRHRRSKFKLCLTGVWATHKNERGGHYATSFGLRESARRSMQANPQEKCKNCGCVSMIERLLLKIEQLCILCFLLQTRITRGTPQAVLVR